MEACPRSSDRDRSCDIDAAIIQDGGMCNLHPRFSALGYAVLIWLAAGSLAVSAQEPAAPVPDLAKREGFDFAKALREGGEALDADQVAQIAVKTGPSVAKAQAAA